MRRAYVDRDVGNAVGHGHAPPKPSMRLISFRAIDYAGALRGFCNIELPSGLKLIDVAVFSKNGATWAALPSKPILDSQHRHVVVNGRRQFTPTAEWRSRDLADRWSAAVVALVRARHPDALAEHDERKHPAATEPQQETMPL